jgi:ABC-type transporter Mla subunit MlaD
MSQPPRPDPGQQWPPPPPAFRPPSRWSIFIAITIAVIGVAVGFVGWFRPVPHNNPPPPNPTYTAQQTADAKAKVCTAFGQVDRALAVAQSFSGSSEQTAVLAVATSTRQVLDFGNRYLLTTLTQEPATPSDLASAVRKQANAYQQLLIGYLDGLRYGDPDLQPATNASVDAEDTIRRSCK